MQGNSNGLTDYQAQASFPQFSSNTNVNSSYGNLPGLNTSFPNSSTHGSTMNITTYNTSNGQQLAYGSISSNSSSSFVMPYDPPSIQQSSTSVQVAAAQPQHLTSNKAIHSCNYCGLVLSSANALMEHKRIHTGDRPFSCHICNKRFTQKAHLNIHKRTHTGEKPYACHICHKRFAQSSHLSSHKRIHTGTKKILRR
ncbi:unnamed protein product [Lymnaea stagnalis]|uniref:C2H2-type domain-containing protein n=1 Tax=Lymnaea stagnalis TaxID=6523 RepID=A0AAV2ISG1_LYMST